MTRPELRECRIRLEIGSPVEREALARAISDLEGVMAIADCARVSELQAWVEEIVQDRTQALEDADNVRDEQRQYGYTVDEMKRAIASAIGAKLP